MPIDLTGSAKMTGKIKIGILDDYADFARKQFARLDNNKYEIQVYQDTLPPYNGASTSQDSKLQLVQRLQPFDVLCLMRERTPLPKDLIDRLPNLKLILTTGLRNASIDLDAAREHKIRVAGAPGIPKPPLALWKGPDSTTQHAVALILALARNLAADDAGLRHGSWQTVVASGLNGKTFGCVGLGRLGVAVSKILSSAFGMKIVAWSSGLTQEAADGKARAVGLPEYGPDDGKTFKVITKEELFQTADFISLHYVLSARSRGIVSAKELGLMKPTAFLINTARSALVVEKDLLTVLKAGKIRGAAIDVYESEPLPLDSEWRTFDWGSRESSRVLLSPHMGFVEEDNLASWYDELVDNVQNWEAGRELNNGMS